MTNLPTATTEQEIVRKNKHTLYVHSTYRRISKIMCWQVHNAFVFFFISCRAYTFFFLIGSSPNYLVFLLRRITDSLQYTRTRGEEKNRNRCLGLVFFPIFHCVIIYLFIRCAHVVAQPRPMSMAGRRAIQTQETV